MVQVSFELRRLDKRLHGAEDNEVSAIAMLRILGSKEMYGGVAYQPEAVPAATLVAQGWQSSLSAGRLPLRPGMVLSETSWDRACSMLQWSIAVCALQADLHAYKCDKRWRSHCTTIASGGLPNRWLRREASPAEIASV